MIRVVLVDDQTLVRQGIKGLLALVPDIEVVGEASDGEDALEKVPALEPDVLLLDVRMPRLNGIAVDREPPECPMCRSREWSERPGWPRRT